MNLIEEKAQQTRRGALIPVILGSCLMLASCVLTTEPGLFGPLVVQAADQSDRAPSGWLLTGSNAGNYRTGVDKVATHEGRPSAYLLSTAQDTTGFGTLMQSIDAANYAGKRVRLRAYVESRDVNEWSGIWMRVDKEKTMVAFDNMQSRGIKGTQPWNAYDVVLDVPEDATGISFGILLTGTGEVWLNNVTLETVGKEVEVTSKPNPRPALSKTPVNLNFSE